MSRSKKTTKKTSGGKTRKTAQTVRAAEETAPQKTSGLDAAAQVLAEAGVDISSQTSKTLADLAGVRFDYIVTVCSHANETCPVFPGKAKVIHVAFDDPPTLARSAATEEEALGYYRRVRDEIRALVESLPRSLR